MTEQPRRSTASESREVIQVRGARTHNLKNVDADLPRGEFIVVTGPSGSGKSSFVFDTIFAEGRRRFLETLSFSARKVVGQMQKPDVDAVIGLPPTVAVGQSLGRAGRLSTVSTLSGIDENLRLLFARLGTAHCPSCEQPLQSRSIAAIVEQVCSLPERTKLVVHAPLVRDEKGDHREVIEQATRDGFVRIRVDGQTLEIAEVQPLDADTSHSIDVVIDRLIVKPGFEERLRESIDLAVDVGRGSCVLTLIDAERNERDQWESTRFSCLNCNVSYPDVDPRLLSFESPYGCCERCRGTGLSASGALCKACKGDRLNTFASRVRLGEQSIADARRLRPEQFLQWLSSIAEQSWEPVAEAILQRVLTAVERRVRTVDRLGLSYLTLDRHGRTLSGGELQRVRLVNALAAGLSGVCYVLDEPTAGLHAADTAMLIDELAKLRDSGATVLTVEHDPLVIDAADFVIRFGPYGGQAGGQILSAGPRGERVESAIGGQSIRPDRDEIEPGGCGEIHVENARQRTLKQASVDIPLRRVVGVAGVSGSGKSTFAKDVLVAGAVAIKNGESLDPGLADSIDGLDQIEAVVHLNQTPPGRSSRSCPATILGVWNGVRKLLARSRIARLRGFGPSRFSFNSREGRCPECRGRGFVRLQLRYLPTMTQSCPVCRGQRFEPATRAATFKGHSASELLALTIAQAVDVFDHMERIARPLKLAAEAGLGYMPLGQPADTLSGGEAQRLKLIQILTQTSQPSTLYVLDEPTSGLSVDEVRLLVGVFRKLVDAGHSILCVEHNLSLLSECDHLIEFGPGAGEAGGKVIASGTPREVSKLNTATGRVLASHLAE